MRKEYKEALEQIKIRMEEAERFAEKLPVFSERILNDKYTGNENWIQFGEKYKDIYLNWGINRGLYQSGTSRNVTNYGKGSYTEFLFCIYINSVSLFDQHYDFNLTDVGEKTPVFFYDKVNSTFYATDEQITGLLEELNNWYLKARKENDKLLAKRKIKKAQEDLEKARKEIEKLSKENEI